MRGLNSARAALQRTDKVLWSAFYRIANPDEYKTLETQWHNREKVRNKYLSALANCPRLLDNKKCRNDGKRKTTQGIFIGISIKGSYPTGAEHGDLFLPCDALIYLDIRD